MYAVVSQNRPGIMQFVRSGNRRTEVEASGRWAMSSSLRLRHSGFGTTLNVAALHDISHSVAKALANSAIRPDPPASSPASCSNAPIASTCLPRTQAQCSRRRANERYKEPQCLSGFARHESERRSGALVQIGATGTSASSLTQSPAIPCRNMAGEYAALVVDLLECRNSRNSGQMFAINLALAPFRDSGSTHF